MFHLHCHFFIVYYCNTCSFLLTLLLSYSNEQEPIIPSPALVALEKATVEKMRLVEEKLNLLEEMERSFQSRQQQMETAARLAEERGELLVC